MSDIELLDPKVTAKKLNVKERTLANWRALGRGPRYTKVGGLVRYLPLDEYIAKHTVETESLEAV